MPTYLLEIDLSAENTIEHFTQLIKTLSTTPPDSDTSSELSEADSVGFTHDTVESGILVIHSHTLATLTKILEPHLPYFPIAPKITQTSEKGVYDPAGYAVQQLLIYVPLDSESDQNASANADGNGNEDGCEAKLRKLKTLFDVKSIQLEREEKVSGMRQGEIIMPASSTVKSPEMQYEGQKCRVWSVWLTWMSAKERYHEGRDNEKSGGVEEEKESLAEHIDWKKMGLLGWGERNWMFSSLGEFLAKDQGSCGVM
ncbi:uncharacterized protein EAF01_001608 [Botrytis porri]|uniref:Uncharacterized protein n=1 Tax=Botrytis porri TaxID=87229 RepID=A0A4Z1L020_9HELO|nr:uncharacterized protein EAF01_001608 [Botrytis porri]KAF7912587.1 hypothetical protein EAF01_001608 [Botrytis porri]TGO90117.1 hypothetical protein BPOR_0078g00070 [Botrytis porri]